MRVLLGESVPRPLRRAIVGHEVRTVRQMGWAGVDNGELLRRAAEAGFAVLMTMDRNLEYQQDLARSGLGVMVLIAPSNRVEHVLPLALEILAALATLRPGQVVHVGAFPDRRRGRRRSRPSTSDRGK